MNCSVMYRQGSNPILLSTQRVRPWFEPCIYKTKVLSGLKQSPQLKKRTRVVDKWDMWMPAAYSAAFRMQYNAARNSYNQTRLETGHIPKWRMKKNILEKIK